jgi:hypothetical protein
MAGEIFTNNPNGNAFTGKFVIACPLLDPLSSTGVENRTTLINLQSSDVTSPHTEITQVIQSVFEDEPELAESEIGYRRRTCNICPAKGFCTRRTIPSQIDTATTYIYLAGHAYGILGRNCGLIKPYERPKFKYIREAGDANWQPNPEYIAPTQPVQTKPTLFTLVGNLLRQVWRNR